MPIRWGRKKTGLVLVGGAMVILLIVLILTAMNSHFQQKDPLYQTRKSICEPMLTNGRPITAQQTESGIASRGDHAERVIKCSFDAAEFSGGDIYICAEYGRVEIVDSPDNRVSLEIRVEASARDAVKAVQDTQVLTRFTANEKRLGIAAWHSTQGYTPAQQQPAWIHVNLQVPAAGRYTVNATANHGGVGLRRLNIEGGELKGFVGLKRKGQAGYVGGTDLDEMSLLGDLNIYAADSPVSGSVRLLSSSHINLHTNRGDIRLTLVADPRTGLDVLGGSNEGKVILDIDEAVIGEAVSKEYKTELHARSHGYGEKPKKVEVNATTYSGNITIRSAR